MVCFCDLCHEGETVCIPGDYECGPVDSTIVVNPLAVCVLVYNLDDCPDPLSRLEGIAWGSVLHVCRYGSSTV